MDLDPSDHAPSPEGLDATGLTWAVLLARWTEFAQAAVALPEGPDRARWRASVPAVIGQQAVTMALGEAERLPEEEIPLAVDRATVLVARHTSEIQGAWRGEAMPHALHELLHDAHAALARARSIGVEWVVGVDRLEMPALEAWIGSLRSGGFAGEVLAAPAGTVLFKGEPAVFARPGAEDPEGVALRRTVSVPRQVFRQLSDDGSRVERDLVVPMEASLVAGIPLLVPMLEGGEVVRIRSAPTVEAQRRGLASESVPVEFR